MKIALFFNVPAGGAKRALYEHTLRLTRRGHQVDAYLLDSTVDNFLPIAEVTDNVYRYPAPSVAASLRDRILLSSRLDFVWRRAGAFKKALTHDYVQVLQQRSEAEALKSLYARMASDIDARGYDAAYVHQCIITQSPPLLAYLKTPSLYYCQDTLRYVYEWTAEELPNYDAMPDIMYHYMIKQLGGQAPLHRLRFYRQKEREFVANTRRATRVLSNSWYSREAILRTTGVNSHVCYLGVDNAFFSPDPTVENKGYVLSVGMLIAHKRHDFIIESIACIPSERRPKMRIIGYEMVFGDKTLGPLGHRLLEKAERLGVELVITKDVSDETLLEAYRECGAVAFAPYLEPFGFVTLEAMACGKPVVGVAEGGVRESIEPGVTGTLTGRDPEEYGAALDRILQDQALAQMLGANGRAAATRWGWERSADTLERHLRIITGAERTPPSPETPEREALCVS